MFPEIKQALAISLAGGLTPTYYLRVAASLLVGLALGAVTPKRAVDDARLAWATGAAILESTILVCAFP